MSEPRDHRRNLPWQLEQGTRDGAIWTEPAIPGAAPVHVATVETTVDALAEYLVTLHNQRLALHNNVDDVRNKAQNYAHRARGSEPVEVQHLARESYVDGYNDGWETCDAAHEEEVRRLWQENASLRQQVEVATERDKRLVESIQAIQKEREDLRSAFSQAQRDLTTYRGLSDQAAQDVARFKVALARVHEEKAELEGAYSDLSDDARIACSLGSSPGAREAAMARIRKQSPAVQDHVEQFEREIYPPNAQGGYPTISAVPTDYPPSDQAGQEPGPLSSYDKGKPLPGIGHHSPSYAEGYRNGREDTGNALKEPLSERDQALYAAHLLLCESVAAREETRIPWQKAVRRWQEGYLGLVSPEDQA